MVFCVWSLKDVDVGAAAFDPCSSAPVDPAPGQLEHTLPLAQLDKQTKTGWECGAGTGLETTCCEIHVEAENVAVKGWRDEF